MVTLDSPAPLLQVRVMVKAGSAADPQGLEGLAYLTGRLVIEGSFGDPKKPVSKEQLGEITRPWGEGAYPSVRVDKEITPFSMRVPREVIADYMARVLRPLFNQPLFAAAELERLRKETLEEIRSNLRFQQIELLGLLAADNGKIYVIYDRGRNTDREILMATFTEEDVKQGKCVTDQCQLKLLVNKAGE